MRPELGDDFNPATYAEKVEAGEKAGEAAVREVLAKRAALVARYKSRS
jgi:hypothetical protein